ncbi:MAG: flagellar hook-basal body complex protein [Planctomycetes bacterium]|nr:flagellar hook-basal body complex protein [Planctomycetota bacterium]MCK5473428.1 flagellar hook-basal body complex protein [Planctomycetota bacterium]
MSFALSAGVTGLQAHQKMLDVAGNNLANVNSTAFKASRITFSELLSETVKKASQPTDNVGGTNPQQMGSGVTVSGISPNMSQGNIENTGNPLDLAIEGGGYFVLNDGAQNIYTRAGSFAVDEGSTLVDPSTGYRALRIGSEGEADGFQIPGDNTIHIPYDAAMPARATSEVIIAGNLSADSVAAGQVQMVASELLYTYGNGTSATEDVQLDQLDQFSGGSGTDGQFAVGESGIITISGYNADGTALSTGLTFNIDENTTLGDFIDHLNNNVLDGSTASSVNGQVRITDDGTGYSRTDMALSYAGDGELEMPAYFEVSTVGGDEVKSINITVYDSQGGQHVLTGAFVRTEDANTWDMLLTSITGDISGLSMGGRRIEGVTFDAGDGSFAGISGADASEFVVTFANNETGPQTIDLNFGTIGRLNGLTQFAGNSTAVAREQDGYEAGRLSTVSVNNEGIVIGAFSNGIKKSIATIQMALFQNAAGLESLGSGYFTPSANSGEAVATQAMTGGAGIVHGGALEKSNTDTATEFVNMIQAQNGFQANARTIKIANEILQELTGLIR